MMHIQIEVVPIRGTDRSICVLELSQFRRIDKVDHVAALIYPKQSEDNRSVKNQSLIDNRISSDSLENDFSINKTENIDEKNFDLSFYPDFGKPNNFETVDLILLKDYNTRTSLTINSSRSLAVEEENPAQDDNQDIN